MQRDARVLALRFTVLALAVVSGLALASRLASQDWYVDVTESAGVDFQHFNGMAGRLYYVEVVGAGGALFDYDGDGDLDLYLVQGSMLGADLTSGDALLPWPAGRPLNDRLLRNDLLVSEDGKRTLRFVDVTDEVGIDARAYGMGAAAADYDNDGDVDLYVLNYGVNQLWRNDRSADGQVRFTEVAAAAGVADGRWSASASFADADRDGDLDLFVVEYLDYALTLNKRCLTERGEPDYCLPNAYRPVADRFYRNRGDGTFEDVSGPSGIASRPGNGLGVIAADFDGDDLVDFYVANDLQPNHLWLNQGDGTFSEDALLLGAAVNASGKSEASMGIDVADIDHDGDLDLFLTHFNRESNTLYVADDGFFYDRTDALGLGAASWKHTAFGTAFVDVDRDGWQDLVVANGAVTFAPGADRKSNPFPLDEVNQLFRNVDGKRFVDASALAGAAFETSEVSRSVIVGDLDNDGDPDLVFTNNSGPARILDNRFGEDSATQQWLGIELRRADAGERFDLGATARLETKSGLGPAATARRDGGYASARDPRLILPIGAGDEPLFVHVQWSDGSQERFSLPRLGEYSRLRKGSQGSQDR